MPENDSAPRATRIPPPWSAVLAAAALVLEAAPAQASFGGRLDLGFGFLFVAAAVVSSPGALLCMIAEWVGARRRPPLWVGSAALGLAVCCLLIALRLIGPGGDSGLFVIFIPPLMTLALVSLLPAPVWRVIAVWCVAIGVAWLFVLRARNPGPSSTTVEGLGALLGGALVSMLLWHLGFWLGQRSLRRAGHAPASAPDLPGVLHHAVDGLKQSCAHRPRWISRIGVPSGFFRWLEEHPGLSWWLGGAAVFYAGIAALTAVGYTTLLIAMLQGELLVADFLGLAISAPNALTAGAWATHGLIWSAVAGWGTWGAAATAGRFDAGQLAPFRLAAMVVAAGMLFWIAMRASAVGH